MFGFNNSASLGKLPPMPTTNCGSFLSMAALGALLFYLLPAVPAFADGGAVMSINPDSDRFFCGESVDVTFAYTPDMVDTPVLRGYSIRIIAPYGLTFTSADILVHSPLIGVNDTHLIIENAEGDCQVDFTFLEPLVGLADPADLFTITMRDLGFNIPNTPVGIATGIFRTPENQEIPVDISSTFPMDVICVAPTPPALEPEPEYSPGTTNTISWSDESWAGAVDYNVQMSTAADFGTIADESGWITDLNHTFSSLTDGQQYFFRGYARNFTAQVSEISNIEQSVQDAQPPVTSCDPLDPDQYLEDIQIPFQASDNLSGFQELDLFYRYEGGPWTEYGSYSTSPLVFTATNGDGFYEFFTFGTDVAGNEEIPPTNAQASTTLDTSKPFGSFAINGGAVATNDPNVTLTNAVVRAVQMRFSNNGTSWPEGWVPYSETHGWVIPTTEQVYTVYAQFGDPDGDQLRIDQDIEFDITPTGAVSDPAASPGHEAVQLSWANPDDPDFHRVEIWRGLVHDGAYNSTYPTYIGSTIPVAPADRAAALASPEWELAGLSEVGATAFTDSVVDRGVFHYEFFALDPANNFSVPAGSLTPATNYVLGDVSQPFDGVVTVEDLTLLGSTYGLVALDPQFIDSCDVGPTDDGTGAGLPEPDSLINLEDQMIFGMNYVPQAKNQADDGDVPTNSGPVVLAWRPIDDHSWSLDLVNPCPALKGVGLAATLPAGMIAILTPGQALTSGETPYSLLNIDRLGLRAGLVILGSGRGVNSTGPLMTVALPADPGGPNLDPASLQLDLRDVHNRPLDFELQDKAEPNVPASFFLAGAFPNPFNPSTTLKFSLPGEMPVRLEVYGTDGRRIAVLLDDTLAPGPHEVPWFGRDDMGRQVASGVYFSRLLAGSQSQVQKMTLMK